MILSSSHYLGEMAIWIDSYPARELFLTYTHTSPIRVASGHLWYNLGPKSRLRPAPYPQRYYKYARKLGTQTRPWTHAIGFPNILIVSRVRTLTTRVPGLSWATRLRGQNNLSGQLCERHAFNMTSNVRSLNDTDRITTIPQHKTPPGLHLFNSTRLCSMIA